MKHFLDESIWKITFLLNSKAISFQIFSHEIEILNSNQFRLLTFVSYEYHFWTRAIANAFWTKIFKSWFELIDFVKLFWMQLSKTNEYVDQIRFRHFSMSNFFIINRFEHIESKESVDFTVYNQKNKFFVFVRIFRNEKMISKKIHFEQ